MSSRSIAKSIPEGQEIEAVSFDDFLEAFDWKQGEHVSFIGPTGVGKTTLSLNLMDRRDFATIVGTKPKDSVLVKFAKDNGYKIIPEFPRYRTSDGTMDKLLLWPRFKAFKDLARQRQSIGHGLQTMFMQNNWAINVDEAFYLTNQLRLQKELELLWTQGRSNGISLMAGTQRPAHVPLFIYDQATHVFFWRDNDERNLRRIGGIGALNSNLIRNTVMRLPEHTFLYVNSRTGDMLISKAKKLY